MATSPPASRFAEPVSFYPEGNGTHVVVTVHDYDEGVTLPVRIARTDLLKMADAEPRYDSTGILQTPTPGDQRSTA
jgi:hypothetical protein